MYVAIETFIDPSDGQPVEADKTHVSESADVYRMFPERFKRASGGDVGRSSRMSAVAFSRSAPPVPATVTITSKPSWLLETSERWRI